jgi:hypothetical protein
MGGDRCVPEATICRGETLAVMVANIASLADVRMREYTSAKRQNKLATAILVIAGRLRSYGVGGECGRPRSSKLNFRGGSLSSAISHPILELVGTFQGWKGSHHVHIELIEYLNIWEPQTTVPVKPLTRQPNLMFCQSSCSPGRYQLLRDISFQLEFLADQNFPSSAWFPPT